MLMIRCSFLNKKEITISYLQNPNNCFEVANMKAGQLQIQIAIMS